MDDCDHSRHEGLRTPRQSPVLQSPITAVQQEPKDTRRILCVIYYNFW